MTNYNERLDEILDIFHNKMLALETITDPRDEPSDEIDRTFDDAKQAITSLIKELVAEAEADIKLWVDDEVIGSDERHSNGKKMVNYWSCEDCGTPEEAWTRNQLRADQRKRLWLEKFEQNLLKALEEK